VVNQYEYVQSEETLKIEKKPVDFLGINYADLIPVLIKGMQEQQAMIEDQAHEISELKLRLYHLEQK
jgi:hypothetical protein